MRLRVRIYRREKAEDSGRCTANTFTAVTVAHNSKHLLDHTVPVARLVCGKNVLSCAFVLIKSRSDGTAIAQLIKPLRVPMYFGHCSGPM